MIKFRRAIIAILVTGAVLAYLRSPQKQSSPPQEAFYGEGTSIRYVLRVRNLSSEYLDETVKVFLPRQASYIFPSGSTVVEDREGNRDIILNVKIPPYGKREVQLDAFSFSPQEFKGSSSQYMNHSRGEEADGTNHLQTALKALTSAGDEAIARAAYHFVVHNIRKSAYLAARRGVKTTLERQEGDCTEHASLFVSLMRAKGIPARVCAGFMREGSHLKPELYHNWAEFFTEGRWVMVDPFLERFDSGYRELIPVRCGERALTEGIFRSDERLKVSIESKV